ncbi:MAG TPA: hypothetical protein VNY36_06435 [Bacteroidia bacterium]|jgi:hypothetical protein|nr:hypothetical protein [Bacteroidia bacterium]
MKNKALLGIALSGLIFAINSCENKEALLPTISVTANCDTAGMTYSTGAGTIQAIINAQCATSTSCHGYGAPHLNGDFSSWTSATFTNARTGGTSSQMWLRLQPTASLPMPNVPQPGWNACDRLRLETWLQNGAPQ